ncbi:MAG: sugar transferase, partial [Anaplasmataceae bacterium]|nr:sugar transferase [Anaplasmataceae bacterium]
MNRAILRQLLFIFGDVAILLVGFIVVFALRRRTPFFPPLQEFSFYFAFLVFYVISFLTIFFIFGLYRRKRPNFSLSYLADYIRALTWWGIAIVTFSFIAQANYSRVLIIYAVVPGVLIPFFWRLFIVWLLPQTISRSEGEEISRSAYRLIQFKHNFYEELDILEGLQSKVVFRSVYLFLKRGLDVFLSIIGISVTVPFLPLVFFLVKRDSVGSIFIRQERVGKDGKVFFIYKLRTMYSDVDLYAPSPSGEGDSRITRVGSFLRRYSLDELPQLWNVLKGEMSIVGPRPEMPFLVQRYNDWQRKRLLVKPGITGLWQ